MTGSLHIAPVVVVMALLAGVLTVHAQPETQQAAPDFFVEATINNATPYQNEQVVYTFRFFALLLDNALTYTLPDFSGFWIGSSYQLEPRLETVNGVQYQVGEIRVEITPIVTGKMIIERAELTVPEALFSGGDYYTETIEVNVRPFPAAAPSGFNGAVGQFAATTHLDRTRVTLGEPIELTLDVQGLGNFDLLPAPDLSLPADEWRIISSIPSAPRYADSTVSGVQLGQKVFTWLLIPLRTGTITLPSIPFVHFDPREERYVETRSDAVDIGVFPAEGSVVQRLADLEAPLEEPPALKPVQRGQQRDTPRAWQNPVFWLALLVPPAFASVIVGGKLSLQQRKRQRARWRRQQALTRALRRLEKLAVHSGGIHSEYLGRVVESYLSERLALTTDQQLVERVLRSDLLSGPERDSLRRMWSEILAMRFVPPGTTANHDKMIANIEHTLRQIDQSFGPRS